MTDVLRDVARRNEEMLARVAERDRKLPRPIKRQCQHDDGELRKAFTINPTERYSP
jgi:hypothetical protein